MRYRSISILFLLAASAVAPAQVFSWKWIKENVVDRVQLSGSRTLGYHQYDVTGDREAFNTLNNYGFGLKRFTDIGSLDVSGRNVGGFATFNARVDTNRFRDPQAQRFTIDYNKRPYRLTLGDMNGSLLNTNRFATFNKSLNGASAEFNNGRFAVKGLYSESKGSARTLSLQGNNSSGPFYLNASQLVRGSEEVLVDGVKQELGRDYVISYEIGSITFVSRIIPPTSTIVVSFEAFGFGSNRGTVQGAGASYDFGKAGRVGVTLLEQDRGGGNSLSQRVELFQGGGAPSTPYFLQFEPLTTRPITVKLDGIAQVENVDYRFDPDNPAIFFFLRFVSLNSTIEVIYTPKPTQTIDGDRRVIGIDYKLPLGKGGNVTYSQATGELKSPVNPLKGTARGIDANYTMGRFQTRASWRDVPRNYVSVETRGFNRNEKAAELGVTYTIPGVRVEASHQDSDVSLRRTAAGGGIEFTTSSAKTSRLQLEDTRRVGEPWRLELSRLESTTDSGDSVLNTAAASTSRTFGRMIARLVLESQFGRAPFGTGSKIEEKNLGLQTIRLESTYTDGKAWSFGGRAGVSQIRAGEENGTGNDFELRATYEQDERLNISTTYRQSDSGQIIALSGFNTGFGLGYNGNGFSSGAFGGGFLNGATDFSQLNVAANYTINPRASLTASLYTARYAGSISSNTQSRGLDVYLDFLLGAKTRGFFSVNRSETEFIGSPQKSNATTLGVGIVGQPTPRWTYDVRINSLITGGTGAFQQDDIGIFASTGYQLANRHRLQFRYDFNRTTGYLPREDVAIKFEHVYRIWQNLSLASSYTYRNASNLDGNPAGAYKARGFDVELRFAF